ncbi:MAG: hypothetical protein Q7U14_08875, partial [Lacisediminimonas sp.]|nr:hypothetical protein [Lacisediminimonas sp.]
MSTTMQAQQAIPAASNDFKSDCHTFTEYGRSLSLALDGLPAKPQRDAAQQAQATALLDAGRSSRERFLEQHVVAVYHALTADQSVLLRLEALIDAAALQFPGLVPDAKVLARENALRQGDKDGHEIDQGLFLSTVLADPACGAHLCHAMLL